MVVEYVPHQGDKWQTPEDILNDPLFSEPPPMPPGYERFDDPRIIADVRDKQYRVAKAPPPPVPSTARFLTFRSGESRKVWPSWRWENSLQERRGDLIGNPAARHRLDPETDAFDPSELGSERFVLDRPTKGLPPRDLITGAAVTTVSRRVLDVILDMDPDGVVWAELRPISLHRETPESVFRVWLQRVIPVIDWARTSVYVQWDVDFNTGQYNGRKWVRYCNDPAFRDDTPPNVHLCRDPHYRGLNLYSAGFVERLSNAGLPNDGYFGSIQDVSF